MKINTEITLESMDVFTAIKDYLKKTRQIDPGNVCNFRFDESEARLQIIVVLGQEVIEVAK